MNPGKVVQSGKGTARIYDIGDYAARTKESILDVTTNFKFGIKGPCILFELPHFDPTQLVPIDYMHALNEGVNKDLMEMWFGDKHKHLAFNISKKIDKIDKILLKIKPPSMFSRGPRSITYLTHYKASEMRNWFLYYLPTLKGILDEAYLQHAFIMTQIMHMALKTDLTSDELPKLEQLIKGFIKRWGNDIIA